MFTGLITHFGEISRVQKTGAALRLSIRFLKPVNKLQQGESVSVNGVCLTAAHLFRSGFEADVVAETLKVTTLGKLKAGDRVHLERALTSKDRFGGHFVSGHIDGRGTVLRLSPEGNGKKLALEIPAALKRYCVVKGSITINGVSLTLQRIQGRRAAIALVPHTLKATLLGELKPGDAVNVEADIPARRVSFSEKPLEFPSRSHLARQLAEWAARGF